MSIKTWSSAVQTFSGNTSALWSSLNVNRDYLFNLHVQLAGELKDRTVLYTQDIEEKYKRLTTRVEAPTKKRKIALPTPNDYLKALFSDTNFFKMIESPIARMTIYFAADIPWALDTAMPLDTFRKFIEELLLRSQKALVANGDPIGIVAAQSASERFTQTTLNSVDWETCMVVQWTSKHGPPPAPADGEIGRFVDALIEERGRDVQLQPDGVTIYLPLKPGEAEALSVNENGEMVWTPLEAVTKHPPINDDGSNTILNVTTKSGHNASVTKGESMLVFRDNKIIPIRGDKIRVGDLIPVTSNLPSVRHEYLDLRTVFKKTEFVFTNELIEAEVAWKSGNFKNRTPYSRSDAIRDVVQKKHIHLTKQACMRKSDGGETLFPQTLKLDRDFGFFVGAYLAEGCVNQSQVVIANNDTDFIKAVQRWPDSLGTTTHVKSRNVNNGTGTSVRFPCRLLVQFMKAICGVGSYDKRVPAFALTAPDDFVKGLLDAYISGNGHIFKKGINVSVDSRSKKLRDGISHLMARFGITTKLSQTMLKNKIKWSTDDNGKPFYTLNTRSGGARIFANNVRLTVRKKQAVLDTYFDRPTNERRGVNIETFNDVHLQPVVSVEEQPSSHPMVYDLTVTGTRNMCTGSGMHLRDSFHVAGTKKSAVTGGIERIKQLLGGTKSLNVPILGPIVTQPGSDPTMLVERSLEEYCEESGVMYKVSDDEKKFGNFCIFLKLRDRGTWANIIRNKLPVSYRRDSYVDADGIVYIKFTTKHTVDDIKLAYAKLIRSHVSGLKSCVEYDEEDKVLIFAPKTPLVKTRLIDKSMHSIIDNSIILENCPGVDLTKMFSNDIYYIQTTLGIAAAESFIFEELKRTLGNEGININPTHINLMAANMTASGSITPNTFAGVNLEDSVILKATFQESTKTFANAAFNNYTDHIKDVSAQIMVGMQPRIGTQRVGCYYKDVGGVIEKCPDSPEYAPLSPEYAELPDDYDQEVYIPSSPAYAPASPAYYVDGELPEPEIDI